VIQPVAEQVADRVRRLVFWNAFVLLDGQSLEDNIPPHYKELFDAIAQPDGGVMLPYPIWRDAFINDADDLLSGDAHVQLLSVLDEFLRTQTPDRLPDEYRSANRHGDGRVRRPKNPPC